MKTYMLVPIYRDDPRDSALRITKGCVNSAVSELGLGLIAARGISGVDTARAMLVRDALKQPDCDRVLFIDADMAFGPEQIAKLLSHNEPIVGLPYANRHDKQPAIQLMAEAFTTAPELQNVLMGPGVRPLLEVRGTGTGCLAITREVFETMQPRFPPTRHGLRTWFTPGLFYDDATQSDEYYSDDYAFCARARRDGFKVKVDTTEPVLHFSSEDNAWLNIFGQAVMAPQVG